MLQAHEINNKVLPKRQYFRYKVIFPDGRKTKSIEIIAAPESGLLDFWYPQSMGYKHEIIEDLGLQTSAYDPKL